MEETQQAYYFATDTVVGDKAYLILYMIEHDTIYNTLKIDFETRSYEYSTMDSTCERGNFKKLTEERYKIWKVQYYNKLLTVSNA